jgi:hypothetical protein
MNLFQDDVFISIQVNLQQVSPAHQAYFIKFQLECFFCIHHST